MNKKKLFMENLSIELKKRIVKRECVVECGVVSIRNMVSDSSREKEIRSHGNVDLEKGRKN